MAEVTFEQQMRELEELVGQLEHGELSLDDALKAFEQGTKLVNACKAQLAQAEMKVEQVINASGETQPVE